MKKKLAALAAVPLFALASCGTSYTFEVNPTGEGEMEDTEGWEGDPNQIKCFTVEADHSSDDAKDEQLGTFVKPGLSQAEIDDCVKKGDAEAVAEKESDQ